MKEIVETIEKSQSDIPQTYCNSIQMKLLVVDYETMIEPDDSVVSFLKALEGVDLYKYINKSQKKGERARKNMMKLRAALFARMIGKNSTRDIARLCKNDIRFMMSSIEN